MIYLSNNTENGVSRDRVSRLVLMRMAFPILTHTDPPIILWVGPKSSLKTPRVCLLQSLRQAGPMQGLCKALIEGSSPPHSPIRTSKDPSPMNIVIAIANPPRPTSEKIISFKTSASLKLPQRTHQSQETNGKNQTQ